MNGEWSNKPDYEFAALVEEGLRNQEKLLQDKFLKPIKITDVAIKKIPYIEYPGFSKDECMELLQLERKLLTIAKNENLSREVALTLRLDKENFQNDEDRIAITMGNDYEVDLYQDTKTYHLLQSANGIVLINMHNHPRNSTFSTNDITFFLREEKIRMLILLSNKGKVEFISRNDNYDYNKCINLLTDATRKVAANKITKRGKLLVDQLSVKQKIEIAKLWLKNIHKYGLIYGQSINQVTSKKKVIQNEKHR
ncbi:MAG: hypothetical protein IKN12_01175 [Selenomonadaceae bacterium]|nr:hypothetical protein [Selenomonadaceae bacterium]